MGVFKKNKSESADTKVPLKNVLDGSVLTRDGVVNQLPYILFLTLIAVVYIGNRYHAEKVTRRIVTLQNELKELRAESITSASQLMFVSKQSEVARLVKEQGLELNEAVEPPQKLVVKSNE